MKNRLCTSCGHVGIPTTQGIGSFAVDAGIWLIALSLSIFSSVFLIMVIPVAWTIFHIAVYRTTTCPQCGDIAMVALESKKAKRYQAQAGTVHTLENS